jgi:hypothetical protein
MVFAQKKGKNALLIVLQTVLSHSSIQIVAFKNIQKQSESLLNLFSILDVLYPFL